MSRPAGPVCIPCGREMRPKTNGIAIELVTESGPYEIYGADEWSCPSCGATVAVGFGFDPIAEHWEDNYQAVREVYATRGILREVR